MPVRNEGDRHGRAPNEPGPRAAHAGESRRAGLSPAELRARAAALLDRIIVRKETTDQVLEGAPADPSLREILYGCLRHYFSLSNAVERALRHPLRVKDHDLKCLMIVGVYQLNYMRIPPHAAVNETVAATRPLGKPWAKALVNAVLRNAPAPNAERSFEHPAWMRRLLERAYGELAPAIMIANNERAPMTLRVNRLRTSPEAYRSMLDAAGIASRSPQAGSRDGVGWGAETLTLLEPLPVAELPGFSDGLVAVQDAGAQLAAPLLAAADAGLAPGGPGRLLDACAAPGGKLFHLLEREPGVAAVALESSRTRLDLMAREASRLGHTDFASHCADATGLDWWDGEPFDRVLIDAPCSGSGTLRRHPDIKLLRQAADLSRYAALQARLLANLWQTLRPGGTLLYCTCSLFPMENDEVIGRFLSAQTEARADALTLPTGQATRYGWQLLPIDCDTDGFYYARLRKAPA